MKLTELKNKIDKIIAFYGDIEAVDINFGSDDYPKIEVSDIELAVVTHPINLKTNVLIFD